MRPAYYAGAGGRLGDFRTLLHPPYTAWNMAHVVIGAALAPDPLDWLRLAITLGAFFAGTGVASHALDELNGRPLGTGFSDADLRRIALAGYAGALAMALVGALVISPWILALAAVGGLLVAAYTLEWWGGVLHTDLGFALSWGGFPVLVGYWAQAEAFSLPVILVAAAATLLSLAQRTLSARARFARRKAEAAEALFATQAGMVRWERDELLSSWETPLRLLAWTVVVLAVGMALGRL